MDQVSELRGGNPSAYADRLSFCHGICSCHAVQHRRLSHCAQLVVREARQKPSDGLPALIAQVHVCACWVRKADPLWLKRRWHHGHVLLACDLDGAYFQQGGVGRYPHALWLCGDHCGRREAVAEALPIGHVSGAACHYCYAGPCTEGLRPKVLACAGGPHQKAERTLKELAEDLLGAGELAELVAQLCEFGLNQVQAFEVKVECPSAPGDGVAELCFAPTNGSVQRGKKAGDQNDLIFPGAAGQHG